MPDPRLIAFCRPCNKNMAMIQDEALGQVYHCEGCRTTVTIGEGRPAIVVDHAPTGPGTTLNGGLKYD